MKIRVVPIVLALTCALALSACGSETADGAAAPDDLAYTESTETTLIDAEPVVDLSPEDVDLVRFEATWVCELQRRTFPSQEAIDEALDENLAGLGIDRAAYDAFRAEVNQSQDLRDSILFSYQENCRP